MVVLFTITKEGDTLSKSLNDFIKTNKLYLT